MRNNTQTNAFILPLCCAVLFVAALASGCIQQTAVPASAPQTSTSAASSSADSEPQASSSAASAPQASSSQVSEPQASSPQDSESSTSAPQDSVSSTIEEATSSQPEPSSSQNEQATTEPGTVQLETVPPYAGELSITVNGNVPYFTDADRTRGAFEEYSPLDDLGRAGAAFALISRDTMPTEERTGSLEYRPSGWQTNTYDWVDQHFVFNRCHLIAWSLAGEGDNAQNLITGTRTLNMEGMRRFEEQVSAYVYRTNNSVLYRVTPVYWGENLVASGVLMEAESLEDHGAGVQFCAYCYNVEPGVAINYATGENEADGTMEAQPYVPSEEETQADFVINKKSRVYHYTDCDSVVEMRDYNKVYFQGTIEELKEQYPAEDGWHLCKKCRENHGDTSSSS